MWLSETRYLWVLLRSTRTAADAVHSGFSQYQIACYGEEYVDNEEIPDFFENAIGAFKKYPTYDWLEAAGITPSNSTTYSLSAIADALTKASGAIPYIGCSGMRYNATDAGQGSNDTGRIEISEVW